MIDIFWDSFLQLLKIFPILFFAVCISQIIQYYISSDKAQKFTSPSEGNFAKAAGIGLITPGPLLAYLPLLKTLKNKGVPLCVLASFITAQALIGPARVILEIHYFGIKFLVYHVILAFFIALGVATGFKILKK
jgi:uncharacterized membrane protein YraQ (UPF0718 family)